MASTTSTTAKTTQKKVIPPPGRKLSTAEAIEQVNRQYGKALAKLAK